MGLASDDTYIVEELLEKHKPHTIGVAASFDTANPDEGWTEEAIYAEDGTMIASTTSWTVCPECDKSQHRESWPCNTIRTIWKFRGIHQ